MLTSYVDRILNKTQRWQLGSAPQLSRASLRKIPKTGAPQLWGLDGSSGGFCVCFLSSGDLKAVSRWTVTPELKHGLCMWLGLLPGWQLCLERECSEIPLGRYCMAFYDLPSEGTYHHFCHVLLVEAFISFPDSRRRNIDFTCHWKESQRPWGHLQCPAVPCSRMKGAKEWTWFGMEIVFL